MDDAPENSGWTAVHTSGGFFAVSKLGVETRIYREGSPVATYQEMPNPAQKKLCHKQLNPDILKGPKIKVERAKWFISELRHFSFLFHEQNPFEIISEIDPRTGENVFRVLVKESVPPQVSAIVGDTVHNLRSALDYLIGELALDNGEAPSENFGFPISRRAHRHVQSRRAQKLKGISPRAERLILWLKANERVNAILWKLNWLDLIDKHNSILLTAASTVQVSAKVGVPGLFVGPDQTLRIAGPGIDGIPLMVDAGTPAKFKRVFPLKDNDEVYRSPAGFVEEVSGTIDIAIGGEEIPEGAPAVELLTQFVDLVERILGIFERQVLQKRQA